MKMAIITVGPPASGKTTWVNSLEFEYPNSVIHYNRDDLRDAVTGHLYSKGGYNFKSESVINGCSDAIFNEFITKDRYFALVDSNTNMNLNILHNYLLKLNKHDVQVCVKTFFDLPLKALIKNNSGRYRKVPEKILADFFNRIEEVKTFLSKHEGTLFNVY